MQRRVYKYRLYPQERVLLMVGRDPVVRHVGLDPRGPVAWIEHDVGEIDTPFNLFLKVTGEKFWPDGLQYVGTFTTVEEGAFLALHVYQEVL